MNANGQRSAHQAILLLFGIGGAIVLLLSLPTGLVAISSNLFLYGVLIFFIAVLSNFPLLYLRTEISLAHIIVLIGALVVGPELAMLSALPGLALGMLAKRWLFKSRQERYYTYLSNPIHIAFQHALLVLPVGLLRLLDMTPLIPRLDIRFNPSAYNEIVSILLLFAFAHTLILLTEMSVRKPRAIQNAGTDLVILLLIEVTPLPFIIISISAYSTLNLIVVSLTAGGMAIFAILINDSNRTRIDMERRLADISLINEISDLMRTSLDKQLLLDTLYEQITDLTGAQNFYVALYDPENEHIYYPIAVKDGVKQSWNPRGFMDRLTDRVIQHGQPLFLPQRAYQEMQRMGVPVGDELITAWLGVPLTTPDQVQGCLAIFSYEADFSFSHDDEKLLNALSGQVSTSLANALLFERTMSRQHEKLEMLGLVGQQISAALRSDQLFELIMNYALEFTGAPVGCIMIYDPLQERFDVKANRGYDIAYSWLPALDGITGRVFRTRTPEIVHDVSNDPDFVDETEGQTVSQLTVPILYNERAMGVIVIESPLKDQFNANDLNFIKQLADQSALAILNASLFDEAQRRYQDQSRLYLVSSRLVATKGMEDVLITAVQAIGAMLNSPITSIYLYHPASESYIHQYQMERENPEGLRFPVRVPLEVIGNLPKVSISPANSVLRQLDGGMSSNLYYHEDWQAVFMPIIIDAKPVGLILAHVPPDQYLSREDVQLASAILAQSAITLQNARLFADVQEGRDRLAAVLNTVSDGVLMVDASGTITLSNQAICRLLEVQPEELNQMQLGDLNENHLAVLGYEPGEPELLKRENSLEELSPHNLYSYQDFYLQRTSAPVYGESDEVLGWVIVIRDVTEEEKTEQARSLITETVVHDLRSPIGAVETTLGFLEEVLRETTADKDVIASVQIAKRSNQRVLRLINSLLDIGRLETGNIELLINPVQLRPLINGLIEELEPQAVDSRLTIYNQVDAALPHVSVDNGLITRVFYNLIDNALKFTPESGLITIEAQTNENELLVTITDTGPGIPLKYREDVFRRFSQVPNQRGRRRGTGLGLTFCKLAVEAHGGRIWVESGPAGVGARFQFTLPLAAQEELI